MSFFEICQRHNVNSYQFVHIAVIRSAATYRFKHYAKVRRALLDANVRGCLLWQIVFRVFIRARRD